jgi:hypothetical protein
MPSSSHNSTVDDHSYSFTKADVTRASHDLIDAKRFLGIAEQTRDHMTQIKRPEAETELMKTLCGAALSQLEHELWFVQKDFDEISAYVLSQQQDTHFDIDTTDNMETGDVTNDGVEPALEPKCITEAEHQAVFTVFLDQEAKLRENPASWSTVQGDDPEVLREKLGDTLFKIDGCLRDKRSVA